MVNKLKQRNNMEITPPQDSVFSKHVPIIVTDNDTIGSIYSIYITKPIDETHLYDELVYLLTHSVKDTDKVHLYLSTPGGYINATMYIIDAMLKCPATITGILSGCIASAGTMITMACDYLEINEYSSMMIHNYRGGYYGAAHEIEMDFKFTHPHTQKFMSEMYKGFLTDEECDIVFSGQDKYLNADEIAERWNNVVKQRELLYQEIHKEELMDKINDIQSELQQVGYTIVPINNEEPKKTKSK